MSKTDYTPFLLHYSINLFAIFCCLVRIGGWMRMGIQKARRDPARRKRAAMQKIPPKFSFFQVKISPAGHYM
jgi:hypothetical protein